MSAPILRFSEFKSQACDKFHQWNSIVLGDYIDVLDSIRVAVTAANRIAGDTPYYGANGIIDHVSGFTHDGEFVLIAEDGANNLKIYPVQYVTGKIWANNHVHVVQGKSQLLDNRFLVYRLKSTNMLPYLVGGTRMKLNQGELQKVKVMIPSYEEQVKIGLFLDLVDKKITILKDEYALLLEYNKGILQKLFDQEIHFKDKNGKDFPNWKYITLGEISNPKQFKTIPTKDFTTTGYPVFGANGYIGFYSEYNHENPTIAVTCRGNTCGSVHIVKPKTYITGNAMSLGILDTNFDLYFVYYALLHRGFTDIITGSAQPQITQNAIKDVDILAPTYENQKCIGKFLHTIDCKITNVKDQIDQFEKWKQGLLQQMFV